LIIKKHAVPPIVGIAYMVNQKLENSK